MKTIDIVCLVALLHASLTLQADEIHDAARINDLAAIKKLVEANRKLLDSRNDNRETVLHVSARYGDAETVTYLISKGADVNARCYNEFTPFHLTTDPKIAKVLIQHGANLKAKAASGTLLEHAITEENFAIIDLLLEAGEKLDLESLVKLGRTKDVAAALEEKPWLAKAPRKLLHTACWSGHLEIVRLLLRNGADPNLDFEFSNVSGIYSPLSCAVTAGHYEIAKELCDHGAVMNVAGGKMYDSLFHNAVADRDIRYVKLMLEHGADVHAKNHFDPMTPLHVAANVGDVEKTLLLLKYKADVNAETPDGATPLDFAVAWGHDEIAKRLIESGAKLNIRTACALGRLDDVKSLLESNPQLANESDKRLNRPPLFWAVRRGSLDLVRLLLKSGADVNARAPSFGQAGNVVTGPTVWDREKAKSGESPLHLAAGGTNTEIVQLLLENGAQIDAQDKDGDTPLSNAVSAGRTTIVQILLERNANVNGASGDRSPLSWAYDKPEIMKLLLSKKPSSNSLNDALASAASHNKEVADLLLKQGAQADIYAACELGLIDRVRELIRANPKLVNTQQPDYPRSRPLNLAATSGDLKTVEFLLDHGAELQPKDDTAALTAAASSGQIAVVRFLLSRGAEINRKDSMGTTPLHAASQAGKLDIVQLLLSSGAQLGAIDVYGDSVLHKAAANGNAELAKFLVNTGISVNATNDFAETPLHKAVSSGHIETAKLLLENGADVNAKNRRGKTPLSYAENEDNRQLFSPDPPDLRPIAELLRKHRGVK